jgi:uncharacterized protein (UPF0333 family)
MFKFNKSAGQASRLLLVLAVVILVAVIIVYLVMRMATPAPKPAAPNTGSVALPVYEKQLGNIRFVFESSQDLGGTLSVSQANTQNNSYLKDLNTTGRFIMVTVGAQNKGNYNIAERAWDIQNIVDSAGRNFIPDDQNTVGPWLPANNSCGALLKPAFDPAPCTKIYEISNQSDLATLKIQVITGKNNDPNTLSNNPQSALLDLIIK